MSKESIVRSCVEKYVKELPLVVGTIGVEKLINMVDIFPGIVIDEESNNDEAIESLVKGVLNLICINLYFPKKEEKGLINFLKYTFWCRNKVYNYLMEIMPEMREFEATLSPANRAQFMSIRNGEDCLRTIREIRTFGLSNLFSIKTKKELHAFANHPVNKEIFKFLILSELYSKE